MKPFASEWFIPHLLKVSKTIDKTGNISLGSTMLKWIVNSNQKPDTTLGGMYSIDEVYDNIGAYYNPKMTVEGKQHLDKLKSVCKIIAEQVLPDHYRFLDDWAPNFEDEVNHRYTFG